ncbi:MAG TPA: hypothetical protein ENN19_14640, partial [Chloroflexi bacterium]|nr:hypothetical protein [Chloroflexota bacterium]
MENLEQAQARLGHIRTVEPIVSALRTISLGSWQEALGQRDAIQTYAQRLTDLLPLVIPHLPPAHNAKRAVKPSSRVALLVIGSERGLVGAFNTTVVERAQRHADWLTSNDAEVSWMALGSRPQNLIQEPLDWSAELPVARPP